jgi:hypothetical protein
LEGGMTELVDRAGLSQELPVKGVLEQVPKVHPAVFLKTEDDLGHLYHGNLDGD